MIIKNEKGLTLIEILIAVTILSVGLLAVASMQGTALRGDSFAYIRTEASTLAQDKLESLMADPFVTGSSNGTDPHGRYSIDWKIDPVPGVTNACTITITVKHNGRQIIKPLVTKRSLLFS